LSNSLVFSLLLISSTPLMLACLIDPSSQPSAVVVRLSFVFWVCLTCASDGSPSTPIKSPYVTFASVVFSLISVSFLFFMGVHGAVVLDTLGLIVEYRMHVIISYYAYPRSTSFVFALWMFWFWFLGGFFEVYPCRRWLLFPYFDLSPDSSLAKDRSTCFFRALTPR